MKIFILSQTSTVAPLEFGGERNDLLLHFIMAVIAHPCSICLAAVPTFIPGGQPVDSDVMAGDDHRFLCRTEAEPSADVVWMINGEPIDRKITNLALFFVKSYQIRPSVLHVHCVDKEACATSVYGEKNSK